MAQTAIVPRLPQGKIDVDTTTSTGVDAFATFTPFLIDCTISENHSLTNTITSHPVEQGANISDHSRPEPESLTLECLVSNTPASTALMQSIALQTEGGADQNPTYVAGYAEGVWQRFTDLHNNPVLLSVTTTLKTYTSMLIESVSAPRTAKDAYALRFSVKLKKIIVVKNKLTAPVKAEKKNAQPEVKKGKVVTQQATQVDNGGPLRQGWYAVRGQAAP